ncbi:hypothetical protein [Shewanella sp. SR44-3]|uniref:hypothetical protein n=1 Tax=unclassified Shewanella TaxID=196818 RepID=UPI0015FDE701|nr:hypothetical protein [Shewanella sp. SR44-3]MBB1268184.1 hypothetical protein [Shewanella sp. SR44-3]
MSDNTLNTNTSGGVGKCIKKIAIPSHNMDIHPGAEGDIASMNSWLKQQEGYVEGLRFTIAEKLKGHSVQFYYDYPESFSAKQAQRARELVDMVKTDFLHMQ